MPSSISALTSSTSLHRLQDYGHLCRKLRIPAFHAVADLVRTNLAFRQNPVQPGPAQFSQTRVTGFETMLPHVSLKQRIGPKLVSVAQFLRLLTGAMQNPRNGVIGNLPAVQFGMSMRKGLLSAIGGEAGCKQLSADFYARVGQDLVLRPLFPGKSLRCAIEEFAAFLIQFLGGDDEQTQKRWWLSLRESHARFAISPAARSAWLKHMGATLEAAQLDEETRKALGQFFLHSSAYVTGHEGPGVEHEELATRWAEQRSLDDAIAAIAAGRDDEALRLAPRFPQRPPVFVGLLARMLKTGRGELMGFVTEAIERDPSLGARRFAGRTLLHWACGAGALPAVERLLRLGIDPNLLDHGGHTPLYAVANECASEGGGEVVRALVQAGADVNACGGVTRATPLHMAARRGHVEIARALMECGAAINAADRKGDTPLTRAINCRRDPLAQLLVERGASR